ncbi:hypothetical protein PORY_002101 [Pneumocystis oryctolagi]|uniref:Uncharacterized protein n=1 Tax=Pneumocystis oryctolagi TaxID=42067 RepID=A0ACB7CA27_9ASCO|nr:hypothetical protein PORY_002101 [Pneumocystis oryctolagi]
MVWESGSARRFGSSRSNGQFMEIGIVGRKTGLRINEDIRRDSFGMEDMDAFFSQVTPPSVHEPSIPAKEMSYKNDRTISLEQSMDVADSIVQIWCIQFALICIGPSRDISDVMAARKPLSIWSERNPSDALPSWKVLKDGSPWISRSPVKTYLKSPALRVPSTQKRERLVSPGQLDWSDGVARRLDFSTAVEPEEEPEKIVKSAVHASRSTKRGQLMQQKTKQKTFSLVNNPENSESDFQDDAQDFCNNDAQDWDGYSKHETDESTEDVDNKMTKKPKKELLSKKKQTNTSVVRKKQKSSDALLKSKKIISEDSPEKQLFSSHSSAESLDTSPKMVEKKKQAKRHTKRSVSPEKLPLSTLSPRVNGTRRSSRTKVAPLAYWRNERIVYELGERRKSGLAMPKIKEIIRVDPISIPNRSKGTSRAKNTSFKKKVVKHDSTSDEEWEEKVDVECEVINWHDKKPIVKRLGIAYPASSYAPRDVANAIIKFQKTFDETPFFATGVMDLPRGGEKTTKPSKHNVMTFVILEGAVEATVHQTSFRLKRGSHFIVPRGNYYSIRNIANKVSRLFFTQATDTLENEELRV